MVVLENASVLRSTYLDSLNQCFPGWGAEAAFTWAFDRRPYGAPVADLLTLSDEGELLAGSAVTYRRIRLADERSLLAGIMTGSWTLPAARGRGCFTKIIQESLRLARNHGAELLLAFVTEENASARQLLRSGATTVASRYLILSAAAGKALRNDVACHPAMPTEEYFLAWARARHGALRFDYTFETWRQQFLDRPFPTRFLATQNGHFAAIEEHAEVWRVQAMHAPGAERDMMCALGAQAAVEGKRLFAFTMNLSHANSLEKLGFVANPGFLMIHAVQTILDEPAASSSAPWHIQSGDRM